MPLNFQHWHKAVCAEQHLGVFPLICSVPGHLHHDGVLHWGAPQMARQFHHAWDFHSGSELHDWNHCIILWNQHSRDDCWHNCCHLLPDYFICYTDQGQYRTIIIFTYVVLMSLISRCIEFIHNFQALVKVILIFGETT